MKKKKKIHPNDWINLATAYLVYNYIPGFYSQLGQGKKTTKLKKKYKMVTVKKKRKGLKC